MLNEGSGFPTLSILDCPDYKHHSGIMYDLIHIEEMFECSGWCFTCNMQILHNSLEEIDENFENKISCRTAIAPVADSLFETLINLMFAVFAMIGVALIMEEIKEDIVDLETKEISDWHSLTNLLHSPFELSKSSFLYKYSWFLYSMAFQGKLSWRSQS